jgi:transposase
MLPESWIPPAEIQQLRDRRRLRTALAEDRRRWGQRLHAYLLHEGWPCSKSNLLRPPGLRWAAALRLPEHARLQVDSLLSVVAALEAQLESVDGELRRFARNDPAARRCSRSAGSGRSWPATCSPRSAEESGDSRRRGKLAKAGSPHLRWALVEAAVHAHRPTAPDLALYQATRERRDTTVARLTVARKIGKRAFHTLRELELAKA